MEANTLENKYAKLSLISVTMAVIITTIHHIDKVGIQFIILGVVLIVLPYLLMLWFRQTDSKGVLWAYGLFNVWIIVGFGLVDGLLIHGMNLIYTLLLNLHGGNPQVVADVFSLAPRVVGSLFLEGTGALTFIAALFVLYYGYKFIQTRKSSPIIHK